MFSVLGPVFSAHDSIMEPSGLKVDSGVGLSMDLGKGLHVD